MDSENFTNKPEQSNSKGNVSVKFGNSDLVMYQHVELNVYTNDKGGYLSGATGLGSHTIICIPPGRRNNGVEYKYNFPEDYPNPLPDLPEWQHQIGSTRHIFTKGELTITVEDNNKASGRCECYTADNIKCDIEFYLFPAA